MTNMKKYLQAFAESLMVEEEKITKDLTYQAIPEWDSIGHMCLIANLENKFAISMEREDIMAFNSFVSGIKILEKYGIQIES